MIEVSLTELGLFVWAMVATAQALKYHQERNMAKHMMLKFIEDEGIRNEALRQYKEWKAEQERA
jgi:hypothetical protein